jgi:hypothetical protein
VWVITIRVLALLALIASGIGAVIVAAQTQPQTITVSLTGTTIVVSEPWRILPADAAPGPDREIIRLAGTNDNLLIGYIANAESSGDFVADVFGEDVSLLGSRIDVDSGPTYSLELATVNGIQYGIFTLAYPNRHPGAIEIHSYISPVSTFADGITSTFSRITVNGERIFGQVDASRLQAILAGAGEAGDPESEREIPPLLSEDVAAEAVEETPAVTPSEVTPTVAPAATVPAAEATLVPVASPGSYVFAGVVEDGRYVSPMTGVEVRWSADWGLAPDANYPSAGHDYSSNVDYLNLVRRDNDQIRMTIEFEATRYAGVETWISEWAFYARTSVQLSLETDGVYASTVVQRGDVILMVKEATVVDGGSFSVVTMLAPIPDMPDAIALAAAEITIGGNPAIVYTTPDKIRALAP